MKSKKGLSRAISTLLAASSVIGGASAGKKNVGKRPNSAGVIVNKGSNKLRKQALRRRAKSAPPLLKNPKTYYFGVPTAIGVAGAGYGLYRLLSKGEKKEEEKKDVHVKDGKGKDKAGEGNKKDEGFELLSKIIHMFDSKNVNEGELMAAWVKYLNKTNSSFKEHKDLGPVVTVWFSLWPSSDDFASLIRVSDNDENDNLTKAAFEALIVAKYVVKFFDYLKNKKHKDVEKFISELEALCKYKHNLSNIINGNQIMGAVEYLAFLFDRVDVGEDDMLRKSLTSSCEEDIKKLDGIMKKLGSVECRLSYNNEASGGCRWDMLLPVV